MKASDLAIVLSGVLLNAVAQLLLKSGAGAVGPIGGWAALRGALPTLALHPGVLGGLVCYAVSVVVWIVALSRVDVKRYRQYASSDLIHRYGRPALLEAQ